MTYFVCKYFVWECRMQREKCIHAFKMYAAATEIFIGKLSL